MSTSNTALHQFQSQAPVATVRSVPDTELKKITSTFAADMQVTGDYKAKSANAGLRVEGEYAGKIVFESGGILHISAGANVTSTQVEADYVVIEGSFSGTLLARKLIEILPSAVVDGDIKYADMDGHRGARVRGKLDTIEASEAERSAKPANSGNVTLLQTSQETQATSSTSSAAPAPATGSSSVLTNIASLGTDRAATQSKAELAS